MPNQTQDDKKLTIQKLLATLDPERLTKEEFTQTIEMLFQRVKELTDQNAAEFDGIHKVLTAFTDKIKNDTSTDFTKLSADLKKQVNDVFVAQRLDAMQAMINHKLAKVRDGKTPIKGVDYFDGQPGKSIDKATVVAAVIAQLPPPDEETAEDQRDKLESLKGDARLDKSAIKGLDDELKRIELLPRGGTGKRQRVFTYDLTSQCNGVLKTFGIPTNFGVIGVFSTEFPIVYRPIIDYTIGNHSITLTDQVSAPATGQTLIVQYIR